MSIALVFWIIMIVWLVFVLITNWPPGRASGVYFVLWILLALLGWAVFGSAIHK